MTLLLDTHILLWVMLDAAELTSATRQMLQTANSLYVSTVTPWEVAIKCAAGKLRLDADALDAHLLNGNYTPLPITWAHARQLRSLPRLHADPFDRMLIAQAMSEPLHLLTHDAALAAYSPLVIVV